MKSRTTLAAALVAATLWGLGVSAVDAMVFASLAGVPRWLSPGDVDLRRRRRRRELPLLLGLASVVAALVIGQAASVQGVALPPLEVALGAAYVTAWMFALRFLRAGVEGALASMLVPRRLAAAGAVIVLLGAGFPLLFVALQTHRAKIVVPVRVPPAPAGGEAIAFASDDGTPLVGTLWLDAVRRPAVVLCHGVGANRAQLAAHAALAHALGCHVLAFDFRGHGESGGRVVTFGAAERRDVAAAVALVRARPQVEGIALLGVSMGGAVALQAAPDLEVAGLFVESSFAELRTMTAGRIPFLPDALAGLAASWIGVVASLQLGVDLDSVSPRAALARLDAGIPVALLHAGVDAVVPLEEGRRLVAARAGLRLRVFASAAHGDCLGADRERYSALLGSFLRQAFGAIAPR